MTRNTLILTLAGAAADAEISLTQIRFAAYGQVNWQSLAVVVGPVAFALAVRGDNPLVGAFGQIKRDWTGAASSRRGRTEPPRPAAPRHPAPGFGGHDRVQGRSVIGNPNGPYWQNGGNQSSVAPMSRSKTVIPA